MRKIEKAVLYQMIQMPLPGSLRSDETKLGYCASDEFLERDGRRCVEELLKKYITYVDENHSYYVRRLWYFDVESYSRDLTSFGIPMAAPVQEKLQTPKAPAGGGEG